MTAAFLTVALISLLCAHLAATANKVLQDIAWHELEDYSRRRDRRRFDEIHDFAGDVAIGTETLLYLAISIHVSFGIAWLWSSELIGFTRNIDFAAVVGVNVAGDTINVTGVAIAFAGASVGAFVLLSAVLWFPSAIAEYAGISFVYHTWPVWRFLSMVLKPLAWGGVAAGSLVRRILAVTDIADEEEALEEEIRTIVAEGQHDGLLDSDTREMIEGVIELDDANVADIMTPRDKMDVMSVKLDWDEVLDFVTEVGRTRIPVYNESKSEFLGILYVKDLFTELRKPELERRTLREMLRPKWNVPTTMHLDELLQQFRNTRNHLALVSDEYNAITGLVTIEDVLEEIVGEIVDESDKEELAEIRVVNDKEAVAVGRAHLQDINEQLGYDLPEDDEFDTIGGFLMHQLGRIPREGESVYWNDLQIRVVKASRRRAELVRLMVVETSSDLMPGR